MKRIISLLLAILTVCTLTLSMSGCGGASKSDIVGVWNYVGENDTWTYTFEVGQLYLYIYEDGTGNWYGKRQYSKDEAYHMNGFEWEIEGEYFVKGSTKYTIDGNSLYDNQGKLAFTKVSNDTSVDIEITVN